MVKLYQYDLWGNVHLTDESGNIRRTDGGSNGCSAGPINYVCVKIDCILYKSYKQSNNVSDKINKNGDNN